VSPDSSTVDAALRLLGRRPLSESELSARLEQRGHTGESIEACCKRLLEMGYLDDQKLALEFIVTRAERLGHAPRRLVDQLCRRGIKRTVAQAALRVAVARGDVSELDLLRRRLRRHLKGASGPLDQRGFARVYNALRRAGFQDEVIRQEIEPYRPPAFHDASTTDEGTDDFP
jgi:regulatory protein